MQTNGGLVDGEVHYAEATSVAADLGPYLSKGVLRVSGSSLPPPLIEFPLRLVLPDGAAFALHGMIIAMPAGEALIQIMDWGKSQQDAVNRIAATETRRLRETGHSLPTRTPPAGWRQTLTPSAHPPLNPPSTGNQGTRSPTPAPPPARAPITNPSAKSAPGDPPRSPNITPTRLSFRTPAATPSVPPARSPNVTPSGLSARQVEPPTTTPNPLRVTPQGLPAVQTKAPAPIPSPRAAQPSGVHRITSKPVTNPSASAKPPVTSPSSSSAAPANPSTSSARPVTVPSSSSVKPVTIPSSSSVKPVTIPSSSSVKPVTIPSASAKSAFRPNSPTTAAEVRDVLEGRSTGGLYAALAIHYSAGPAEIKRAYENAVADFAPGTSAHKVAAEDAERITQLATRAWQGLRERKDRDHYRREVLGVNVAAAARLMFDQAHMATERGERASARALLEAAVDLNPTAQYEAALAALPQDRGPR